MTAAMRGAALPGRRAARMVQAAVSIRRRPWSSPAFAFAPALAVWAAARQGRMRWARQATSWSVRSCTLRAIFPARQQLRRRLPLALAAAVTARAVAAVVAVVAAPVGAAMEATGEAVQRPPLPLPHLPLPPPRRLARLAPAPPMLAPPRSPLLSLRHPAAGAMAARRWPPRRRLPPRRRWPRWFALRQTRNCGRSPWRATPPSR